MRVSEGATEGERGGMVRFDNDPFLSELMNMLKKNRQSGSVTVTMKRSSCLVSGGASWPGNELLWPAST